MPGGLLFAAAATALLLPAAALAQHAEQISTVDRPPNVVLVLTDDQGWVDSSVQMDDTLPDSRSDYYETPNLERLAARGMRFSAAYSASPICSPSRASVQTGKSPDRLHLTDIIESLPGSERYANFYSGQRLLPPAIVAGLPPGETTIAEFIRERAPSNYATAHFGKWHLGSGGPQAHGYEISDGSSNNDDLAALSDGPDPKSVFGLTGRALQFMRQQSFNARPFFVQISHYAVHTPERATRASRAKYEAKARGSKHTNAAYAAMLEDLDTAMGELLAGIEALGLTDNTYVIFTSDNGGSMSLGKSTTSNAPLRNGKTSVYEGGIRVPFFVAGPGIAAGSSTRVPIVGWDLFPTICAMVRCRGPLPSDVDGGNALELMRGKAQGIARARNDQLLWHFPHYLVPRGTTPQTALRSGDYKLVRVDEHAKPALYHLGRDPGEGVDLREREPDLARRLEREMDALLASHGARRAQRNARWLAPEVSSPAQPLADSACCAGVDRIAMGHRTIVDGGRFTFAVPQGWYHQPEGLTDWLAPQVDAFFWGEHYDSAHTPVVAVATVSPFLSMADRPAGKSRPLLDAVQANLHTLRVNHGANLVEAPRQVPLAGREAIDFLVKYQDRVHYQVLVRLADGATASVSGINAEAAGPAAANALRAVVAAIAASVGPVPAGMKHAAD